MAFDAVRWLLDGSRGTAGHRIVLSTVFLGLAGCYRRGPAAPVNPTLLALAGCCFFVAGAGTMLVGRERRRWFDRVASLGLLLVVVDWVYLMGVVVGG